MMSVVVKPKSFDDHAAREVSPGSQEIRRRASPLSTPHPRRAEVVVRRAKFHFFWIFLSASVIRGSGDRRPNSVIGALKNL
jgi:hypothetical protein